MSIEALDALPRRRMLWLLFYHFFMIALLVVGGGYAIALAAERIFINKLKWLKPGELIDMLAVIQTIPGLLAGNAALYVGYRAAGKAGALVSLFGVALPSFLVISAISAGFSFLPMENPYVQGAFTGVRTAMAALTLAAACRLWKKVMNGIVPLLIAPVSFILILCRINPSWVLLGAVICGSLLFRFADRENHSGGEERRS